jgi:tRNA 2-thiouridine synthesizing protein D
LSVVKFTIVLHAAPYTSQASLSALRFAQASLAAGHEIVRVFFYYDGVHNTNEFSAAPQDELDLVEAWSTLLQEHGIDAVTCVSSSIKRGIIDTREARRHDRQGHNLRAPAVLSGLGQLVDASLASDRTISFGA